MASLDPRRDGHSRRSLIFGCSSPRVIITEASSTGELEGSRNSCRSVDCVETGIDHVRLGGEMLDMSRRQVCDGDPARDGRRAPASVILEPDGCPGRPHPFRTPGMSA